MVYCDEECATKMAVCLQTLRASSGYAFHNDGKGLFKKRHKDIKAFQKNAPSKCFARTQNEIHDIRAQWVIVMMRANKFAEFIKVLSVH